MEVSFNDIISVSTDSIDFVHSSALGMCVFAERFLFYRNIRPMK